MTAPAIIPAVLRDTLAEIAANAVTKPLLDGLLRDHALFRERLDKAVNREVRK